eukprot:3325118-Karenia_brevis.AAC.1
MLSKNALGASLVPVPGIIHCKQCFASPKSSKPGSLRRIAALPGGNVKQTTRSFSPAASASS